ncbi:hypothetical protein KGM48_00420 [Patescibacteria group bacterium]|nr:hypothetical protein [Patescibacteria group bacterium]
MSFESAPRGREALSTGEAIAVQIHLMKEMLPPNLQIAVGTGDGENVGIEDALFERWADKYSKPFSDFCDEHAGESELIEHLKTDALTPEETAEVITYLRGDDRH